ncbi:hypothetical protein BDZ94DRAFT_1323658 [Collybia nuda]|uniref:F-box domain-containing protein n=1 Tax=Collybia nuda TaxID=64659 RepID=A0A9P5Y2G5_9AGAR|nr:hypothetical protein BDZ94DRAFT_1323658 [Collybia nuda]
MIQWENPFSSYPLLALSSNPPSEIDDSSARAQIKIAEEEIHKLDVELSLILARRAYLVSRLGRCRQVIAPYKKLPTELVRKILLLCVPKVRLEPQNPPKQAVETINLRLQITQVCAKWREIAFSEPALWDLIIIPKHNYIELATAWFHQSSCSKIGLAVQQESTLFERFSLAPLSQIIDKVIAPHTQRQVSLSLTVDKPLLERISHQSFEILESLALDLDTMDPSHWEESDLHFKKPTPCLRSVYISMPSGILDERLCLGLPLSQLTELKLDWYIVAADLVRVLNQCALLEKCAVRSVYERRIIGDESLPCAFPNTNILLPHLRCLEITLTPAVRFLLYLLETPNLLSLQTDINFSSSESHSYLRHLRKLRRIMISGTDEDGFIDEGFLSSIPASVEVCQPIYPFRPFTLLKIGAGDLLPKVETLELRESDPRLVLDMLGARLASSHARPGSISHIKALVLHCADGEGEFHLEFDAWRLMGMDIRVVPW